MVHKMSTKPTYAPIPLDLDGIDDENDVPRVRKHMTAERWAGKNLATVMFSIVAVVAVFLVGLLVGQSFPSASTAGREVGGSRSKSQVGGDAHGEAGLKSFIPVGGFESLF